MKKTMTLLVAVLLLALCLTGCGGKETLTLNVYKWGHTVFLFYSNSVIFYIN